MNPIAYADQFHAAARETAQVLLSVAVAETGRPPVMYQPDSWVLDKATAVVDSLRHGTARCCPHLGNGPQPVHAALWAPGRVVCTRCLPTLRPATALEDSTCDHCRRLVRQIYACAATTGPLLITFGLCRACLPHNHSHTTEETTR